MVGQSSVPSIQLAQIVLSFSPAFYHFTGKKTKATKGKTPPGPPLVAESELELMVQSLLFLVGLQGPFRV